MPPASTPPVAAGEPAGARERLLDAGLELFARVGFHGTTTRALARRAGVNLAAIPYHFGTKRQLYLAVAEALVARIAGRLRPELEAAQRTATQEAPSPEALLDALTRLLDRLARVLLSEEASDDVGRFVLAEQLAPSEAFDLLFEGGMREVHGAVAALLGRLLGAGPDDAEVRMRTSLLLGQVLVFRAARALVLRTLDRDALDGADVRAIRGLVEEHTRLVVGSLRERAR